MQHNSKVAAWGLMGKSYKDRTILSRYGVNLIQPQIFGAKRAADKVVSIFINS
jgi:hypothetical protein